MEYPHIWTVTDLIVIDEKTEHFFNKKAYKELTLDNLYEFTSGLFYNNINNRYYNNYPQNLKVLAHFFKIKCDEWVKINKHLKESLFYTDENVHESIKSCLIEIEENVTDVIDVARGKTFYIRVTPTIIGHISFNLYFGKNNTMAPSSRLFTFTGLTEFTTSRNIKIAGSLHEGVQSAKLSVEPFFYRDFLFSEGLIEKGVVSAAPSCATFTHEDFTVTIRGRHTNPKYKDCWATLNMKFSIDETDSEHLVTRFNDFTNFVKLAYREESISAITEGLKYKFEGATITLQKPITDDELHVSYFDGIERIIVKSDKVNHWVYANDNFKDHSGEDVFNVNVYKGNNDRVHHVEISFPKITEPFTLFTQVPRL